MTNRRKFLMLVGGGVVLAAGGAGSWAMTRDPARARLPWEQAGEAQDDPRRKALSYAILAPNPHNRQPWLADLSVPDEITLYCQQDRRLPHTDPYDRQITVGLGCFLELLSQAAVQDGWRAEIELFPEGEPQPRLDGRPVARVRFAAQADVQRDPLFGHALQRRSNKEPFDASRAVETGLLGEIASAARTSRVAFTNERREVEALRTKAWDAMDVELRTYRTAKESVDLLRIGKAEIEANPDGIDLAGPLMEALSVAGLLDREAMLDVNSTVFRQQAAALKPSFDTAMAFMWLATPGNSRADQIRAGRDYVRLNLAATGLGVDMHPMSQALQEYPEMQPHFDGMRSATGMAPGETLQMFVRLGYGPKLAASPRWPYETRIRTA
ncbi:MAG: nitroreductase family protein [Brucellaceae bacterium]|nr:nitroreductase family protein [Brucellaceae bacterium]